MDDKKSVLDPVYFGISLSNYNSFGVSHTPEYISSTCLLPYILEYRCGNCLKVMHVLVEDMLPLVHTFKSVMAHLFNFYSFYAKQN